MTKAEVTGSAVALVIVDTDPRVGRAFARLLSAADLGPSITSITSVADAAAAISSIGARQPSLAVVTLGLSDLDAGLDAIALLHATLAIPVIALSSRDGLRGAALERGASAFIDYGSAPEDVLATIRDALFSAVQTDQLPEGA
jgi:DNA-binding response OmpR family regulator